MKALTIKEPWATLINEEFEKELLNLDSTVYGRGPKVGRYAWELENVVKYDTKIPVKGKLGLWNYEIDD